MNKTFVSDLSKKRFPISERIPAEGVRIPVMELIQKDFPDFDGTKFLSLSELNIYREKYIANYLSRQVGELSELDNKVVEAIADRSLITDDTSYSNEPKSTLGERVADNVASFGGSWTFIISFIVFLLVWIAVNAFVLLNRGFDPYPFILLNLILSCLAALQAPVIMMSQNRQADKDRQRAKDDYMVNLKSELEVRALHEKIDHLMMYQQQELIEVQKVQIDMLNDIRNRMKSPKAEKHSPAGGGEKA